MTKYPYQIDILVLDSYAGYVWVPVAKVTHQGSAYIMAKATLETPYSAVRVIQGKKLVYHMVQKTNEEAN